MSELHPRRVIKLTLKQPFWPIALMRTRIKLAAWGAWPIRDVDVSAKRWAWFVTRFASIKQVRA